MSADWMVQLMSAMGRKRTSPDRSKIGRFQLFVLSPCFQMNEWSFRTL